MRKRFQHFIRLRCVSQPTRNVNDRRIAKTLLRGGNAIVCSRDGGSKIQLETAPKVVDKTEGNVVKQAKDARDANR